MRIYYFYTCMTCVITKTQSHGYVQYRQSSINFTLHLIYSLLHTKAFLSRLFFAMLHANIQLKRMCSIYSIYNQILICQIRFLLSGKLILSLRQTYDYNNDIDFIMTNAQ